MFFSRWLKRCKHTPLSFKPSFCVLEDRITPSKFGWTPPTPGPATHLIVEAPHSVKVGQPFTIEVEALDANNRLATGYTGTIAFTLGTADAGSVLPANFTFTASDHGFEAFNVTLTTAQKETITATDTASSTIIGSATTTVNAAPAATHFLVEAPKYVAATGEFTVTVVALSANNRVATGYAGTVSLTSSDANASLPGSYTFSPGTDNGTHTFTVSLSTAESATLTATDTTTSTITGKASITAEAATAVTQFKVLSFGFALPGLPTYVLVEAMDANNHVLAGYTGTVTFTSSDASATLPANYTFTASDDGRHIFAVTFNTAGTQTLTTTDSTTAAISGSGSFYVPSFKFHFGFGWW
jgi:biotin carboxyl carrier protein